MRAEANVLFDRRRQVGVAQQYLGAGAGENARPQRRAFALVLLQPQPAQPLHLPVARLQGEVAGSVAAPVVDDEDLHAAGNALTERAEAIEGRADPRGFVVRGNDDGELGSHDGILRPAAQK